MPRFEKPQSEYIEKVVYLNRVSKTVKGGRVMKFSLGGAGNLGAHALMPLEPLRIGIGSLNHFSARLLTSSRRSYRPCGGPCSTI